MNKEMKIKYKIKVRVKHIYFLLFIFYTLFGRIYKQQNFFSLKIFYTTALTKEKQTNKKN